jgi:RNA polymerase sigma-70 factor (ECF subfamily)
VQTTDEELLRALCRDHAGALLNYAIRLTDGDRGLAEDIVQETLIRAWRNPAAVDPRRGSARPWLFTVALHLAIDGKRARRARPAEVAVTAAAAVGVPDGLDRALESWLVEDALSALSPDHRAVLIETYYRGGTAAAAAAALGVPVGTVKSRAYYALRALRLALEERGILQ